MQEKYDPKNIESKWHKLWKESGIYKTKDLADKPKFFALDMFPYPSGAGLHVGHPKGYTATDVISRKKMLEGANVLHPMGWDAFGLPTENYAIKNKIHPRIATEKNIAVFKKQLEKFGFTYDWEREIATTDPEFYKWTQWIFLKMFEKGLAYESDESVNWCPSCKTVLANEDLEGGLCERCGTQVVQKKMKQWVLKMTAYADRLLADLDKKDLDWEDLIKEQQRNWIGRSEGATVKFQITNDDLQTKHNPPTGGQNTNSKQFIEVFTTRLDTIFGCTYCVVAPEHKLISELKGKIENYPEIEKYIIAAQNKTNLERTELQKEKTGVELKGIKAINPFTNEEVPVWVADYVLVSYGTGAVMAVPAHDERDFDFAKKYDLLIKGSVAPYICLTGANEPKSDKETTRKNNVTAILRNPDKKRYLLLQWKDKFYGFAGGAIEKGEAPEEAILREITEETGYKNLKIQEVIISALFGHGYKQRKDKNNFDLDKVFLVDILDDEKNAVTDKIRSEHEISWWNFEEVGKLPLLDHHQFMWGRFLDKKKCFTDNGILINSGKYDGLTSEKAREEMVKWLEEKNIGKRKVNYKMRDWVFSRQRYWGEPIPIIKCKQCGLKKLKIKMELNFRVNEVWDQIIANKKTIETRALNPDEKDKFFGGIKVGDLIRFNNKNTKEFEIIKINKVYNFKNLNELFGKKDLIGKIVPDVKIEDLSRLKKCFSFTEDYLDRIEKNGLVGWEFEKVDIMENIPVPEKDLPVRLPDVESYEPTGTGESPLANITEWVNVKCPKCGGAGRRETNTMPQWAGSSWYYLRYIDPKNSEELVSKEKEKYWMPVDLYVGGAEHATRHLLYARFWHKFLYDIGAVSTVEPFKKLFHVGLILAEDGRKMSKRWGNVINPDDVIAEFGADSFRLYAMFMGPFSQAVSWSMKGVVGMKRFLDRVWMLSQNQKSKIKNQNDNEKIKSEINLKTEEGKTRSILVASNNEGKLKELKDHLGNFKILSLKELKVKIGDPEETGKTFAENSLLKAKYYAEKTGFLTVADDSGLSINSLDGEPGVFSSRYAEGDYKKAHRKILDKLKDSKDRSAYFQSVVTLYDPKSGKYDQFEGKCEGCIAEKTGGSAGFGYDPIFVPDGLSKTFGECLPEEKYRFDHRKKAIDKMMEFLSAKKNIGGGKDIEVLLHKTIKKVGEDIENFKFNTAISALMILSNEFEKSASGGSALGGQESAITREYFEKFLILLSPFTPHIAEEIWNEFGNKESIFLSKWPEYNKDLIKDEEIEMLIQINGKLRDKIKVSADISEEDAKKIVLESEKIKKAIEGKDVKKVIYVKGRLVNIVI